MMRRESQSRMQFFWRWHFFVGAFLLLVATAAQCGAVVAPEVWFHDERCVPDLDEGPSWQQSYWVRSAGWEETVPAVSTVVQDPVVAARIVEWEAQQQEQAYWREVRKQQAAEQRKREEECRKQEGEREKRDKLKQQHCQVVAQQFGCSPQAINVPDHVLTHLSAAKSASERIDYLISQELHRNALFVGSNGVSNEYCDDASMQSCGSAENIRERASAEEIRYLNYFADYAHHAADDLDSEYAQAGLELVQSSVQCDDEQARAAYEQLFKPIYDLFTDQPTQEPDFFDVQDVDLPDADELLATCGQEDVLLHPNAYEWRERYAVREQAIKELQNDASVAAANHTLSADVQNLLRECNCNVTSYQQVTGNVVQRVLHAEIVGVVEQAAELRHTHDDVRVCSLTVTAVEFSDCARAHNRAGRLVQTCSLIDFSYAVIDYARALGEGVRLVARVAADCTQGVVEGFILGAGDLVRMGLEPIQTVQNIAMATWQIGSCLARVVWDVRRAVDPMAPLERMLRGELDEPMDYFEFERQLLDQLHEAWRVCTAGDLARGTTRMVVNTYLMAKTFKCAGDLVRRARQEPLAAPLIITSEQAASDAQHVACFIEHLPANRGLIEPPPELYRLLDSHELSHLFAQKHLELARQLAGTVSKGEPFAGYLSLEQEVAFLEDMFQFFKNASRCKKVHGVDFVKLFGEPTVEQVRANFRCLAGMRHDYRRYCELNGLVGLREKAFGPHNMIRAQLKYQGILSPPRNMFPPEWTREKVLTSILDAFGNPISGMEPIIGAGDCVECLGMSEEGLVIRTVVDRNTQMIVDAEPIMECCLASDKMACMACEVRKLGHVIEDMMPHLQEVVTEVVENMKTYPDVGKPKELPLEHLFLPTFKNAKMKRVVGFHYDFGGALEAAGMVQDINMSKAHPGFYSGRLVFNGRRVKRTSTFFPKSWSPEKVIRNIGEAWNSLKGPPEWEPERSAWIAKGRTGGGPRLEFVMRDLNHLDTVYPFIEDM